MQELERKSSKTPNEETELAKLLLKQQQILSTGKPIEKHVSTLNLPKVLERHLHIRSMNRWVSLVISDTFRYYVYLIFGFNHPSSFGLTNYFSTVLVLIFMSTRMVWCLFKIVTVSYYFSTCFILHIVSWFAAFLFSFSRPCQQQQIPCQRMSQIHIWPPW